jgi:TRAP-type C4-dicarboxylate transport system permease small subunit
MAAAYRLLMNVIHWSCVGIGGLAMVLISAVIPWAVFTRYVLNSASSWPEPMAVLLILVVTFLGAASCYRLGLHMNMTVGTDRLPPQLRGASLILSEVCMGAMALFMVVYGARLVQATWGNSVDEFPWLSVGITYLPVPLGGAAMLLFVIERLWLGAPAPHDLDKETVIIE